MIKISVLTALFLAASRIPVCSAGFKIFPSGYPTQCASGVQARDGPGGYQDSYQVGNRAAPVFYQVGGREPFLFTYKLPRVNAKVHVTLKKEKFEPEKLGDPNIRYTLSLYNHDSVKRYAQLAWSKDKDSKEPYFIYTIGAEPGDQPKGCLEIGDNHFYLTAQSF